MVWNSQGKRPRRAVVQSLFMTLITWFGGPTPGAGQNTGNLPPGPPIVNLPLTTILAGNGNDNLPLAVFPNGQLVHVSNQVSETISVIATASSTIVNTIGGFSCPFESSITRRGSKLVVSSQCDNSLKVVNLATNSVVNSTPSQFFSFDYPDRKRLRCGASIIPARCPDSECAATRPGTDSSQHLLWTEAKTTATNSAATPACGGSSQIFREAPPPGLNLERSRLWNKA